MSTRSLLLAGILDRHSFSSFLHLWEETPPPPVVLIASWASSRHDEIELFGPGVNKTNSFARDGKTKNSGEGSDRRAFSAAGGACGRSGGGGKAERRCAASPRWGSALKSVLTQWRRRVFSGRTRMGNRGGGDWEGAAEAAVPPAVQRQRGGPQTGHHSQTQQPHQLFSAPRVGACPDSPQAPNHKPLTLDTSMAAAPCAAPLALSWRILPHQK